VQGFDLRRRQRDGRGSDHRLIELALASLLVHGLRVRYELDGQRVETCEGAWRRVSDQRAHLLEPGHLLDLVEEPAPRLERARNLAPRPEHDCPAQERQEPE
jgi:hypothetical protein